MLRLLAEFYSTVWALDPLMHAQMEMILERWASGVRLSAEEVRAAVGDGPQAAAARREAAAQSGGDSVAVVPVHGILTHRAYVANGSISTQLTSTETLAAQVRSLAANPEVASIVLDIDSPGGSVFGVQELGDTIHGLRGTKPIIGVASPQAASAAYWILSQCTEAVVTPSGAVGSIGAFSKHVDNSAKNEKDGRRETYVYAGKYKVEGNDAGPLGDDTKMYLQTMVDSMYSAFVRAVARGRGVGVDVVRGEAFGEGRMRLAREAQAAGMVDRIATLDEVIKGQARASRKRGSALSASTAAAQVAALEAGNPIAV